MELEKHSASDLWFLYTQWSHTTSLRQHFASSSHRASQSSDSNGRCEGQVKIREAKGWLNGQSRISPGSPHVEWFSFGHKPCLSVELCLYGSLSGPAWRNQSCGTESPIMCSHWMAGVSQRKTNVTTIFVQGEFCTTCGGGKKFLKSQQEVAVIKQTEPR